MNKEAAQKWVDELIFGNHSQTTDDLHDTEGYCGLGVACLVYAKENGLEVDAVIQGGDYQFGFLPTTVQGWLDIDSDVANKIVVMNDVDEVPLADIGVFIRDTYLKEQ